MDASTTPKCICHPGLTGDNCDECKNTDLLFHDISKLIITNKSLYFGIGPLFRRSAILTRIRVRVRFRVRDRVRYRDRVRVRLCIVWYMDAQTAVRFGIADLRNS